MIRVMVIIMIRDVLVIMIMMLLITLKIVKNNDDNSNNEKNDKNLNNSRDSDQFDYNNDSVIINLISGKLLFFACFQICPESPLRSLQYIHYQTSPSITIHSATMHTSRMTWPSLVFFHVPKNAAMTQSLF